MLDKNFNTKKSIGCLNHLPLPGTARYLLVKTPQITAVRNAFPILRHE
jgi:hypothetical protein